MIERIHFKNFKALRDTTLPLGRFTLIVGPNGSGKSTALQALRALPSQLAHDYPRFAAAGVVPPEDVGVDAVWDGAHSGITTAARWDPRRDVLPHHTRGPRRAITDQELTHLLTHIRVYSFDASDIARPVELQPQMELGARGNGLAGVLDRLRDQNPERFDALNSELARWIPEFDRVLFDTPQHGHRAVQLRTREAHYKINAAEISQGTLLALAMLAVSYLPDPPPLVGFEEPDRGLHPRLLRDVRDALYRLAYPENFGETRRPVQVIATTHSPYFVDLFSDHPEEIVIAEKVGSEARFSRLIDQPNVDEILRDAHLGDVWYSGVLGGVPCES